MAEEFQKYKDILDWEKKEFKKQLLREVSTSWFFSNKSSKQYFGIKWNWNFCNKFSQNYNLV